MVCLCLIYAITLDGCPLLTHPSFRDFTDTGLGNSDEIDELKIAEHYKLGAATLRPLHRRSLRAEVQVRLHLM